VSTLEALRAGVPPLVTTAAGTRSEARAVDDSLVVDPTPTALAAGVVDYFERDRDDREHLAAVARDRGARFDADSRKQAFREAFERVLAAL
jgi:glycosyltransferase involved in cell wall biosynthesis